MSRIVSKLNLNKTPQLVESNSMIFAKNIKLLKDGSLGQDDSLVNILNLNNATIEGIDDLEDYKIVGVIPYNTKFYLFIYDGTHSAIVEYNEHTNTYTKCECNWNYSEGIIDGNCVVNLNGDILLNICEYFEDDSKLIPIKTINLGKSTNNDDESFYTQTPKIHFINLNFIGYYNNNIPNGTYQFFIRYEIRDDFYTNWFPASKELFAGTRKVIYTQQGPLAFIDDTIDSGRSFKFKVDKLLLQDVPFKSFQIGFICIHDDTSYARAWKKFSLDTTEIYFDTDTEYLEEVEIEDMIAAPYNLYNVKNITSFKNKQYVSNYIETDFNPNLQDFADTIDVSIGTYASQGPHSDYNGYPIDIVEQQDATFITKVDGITVNQIVSILLDYFATHGRDQFEEYVTEYKGITMRVFNIQYGNNRTSYNGYYAGFESFRSDINEDPEYGQDIFQLNNSGTFNPNLDTALHDYNVHNTFCDDGNFYRSLSATISNIAPSRIYAVELRGTNYTSISIDLEFDPTKIHIEPVITQLNDYYTLMPGQEYEYYVHLVKNTGEYTNGYKLQDTTIVNLTSQAYRTDIQNHTVFYPIFTFNQSLPDGYAGCFITIRHIKNKTSEVFNVEDDHGDCLDLDIQAYSDFDNLLVTDLYGNTGVANHYASFDNRIFKYFGSKGKVVFNNNDYDNHNVFIKYNYESNDKYTQLLRITPYIVFPENTTFPHVYNKYTELTLYSYICNVVVLYDNFDIYVSGNDVYKKYVNDEDIPSAEDLTEAEFSNWLKKINEQDFSGQNFTIYSNYNLNYLTKTQDLNPTIISKSFEHQNNNQTQTTVLRGFVTQMQSFELTTIYELKSMYKDFIRKTYVPYNDSSIIKFDNTVRSSVLEGDEATINIFKFKATDYYNVPTDKGIIVNLKSVGEAILVHTQDSLYKFTGANSLMAAGGEDVAMKEGEPFDTGIQEIFGSHYGFAGLQHKHQHILSENGYSFYDSDANVIYLFNGQQQMNTISDDINKLLHHKPIKDIQFASDYYNDRFFIQIMFVDDTFTNISFNFKSKSFISIHDFKFDNSFNTKTKCYFIKKDANNKQKEIYVVKDEASRSYNGLAEEEDIYPTKEGFTFNGDTYVSNVENASIVDIILSEDYANVKTLNAISWVCNLINGFSNTDDIKSKFVAEESLTPYPGAFVRIYTDSTSTALVDIHKASNPYSISITESYKYPRYNLGQWTLNYFRNILNTNDITRSGSPADQQSLIYGKYIVIRFVFSNEDNFKLEDVNYNIAPYNR